MNKSRRTTIVIASLSALAIVGGIIAATTVGSSSIASPTTTVGTPSSGTATATVRVAPVKVGSSTETTLVNQAGLPLYLYRSDTASQSKVTGALAAAWPPVLSNAPSATGATGTVSSVTTASGRQVTYNGHFLYTFVSDSPGVATGQDVQGFVLATPGVSSVRAGRSTTPTAPAPSSNGYGY